MYIEFTRNFARAVPPREDTSAVEFVLLSKACPTLLASDQTKGGVGRVYREHQGSVPESKKIRSDEDTALIQIESTVQYPQSVLERSSSKQPWT